MSKKNIKKRISLRLYNFILGRILKARARIRFLILCKIQRFTLTKFNTHKINTINNITEFFGNYIVDDEFDERKFEVICDLIDDVENIKLEIIKSRDIKALLSIYHAATSFYYSYGGRGTYFVDEIEDSKKKAVAYDPDFKEVNSSNIFGIDKKVKNDIKLIRKENRAIVNDIIAKKIDDATPKLEVDASKVKFIISLSASLFLVTGYVFNKYYLGYFGIEVSDFFTIGDYLASSIDKISIAIFSGFIGIGSYLLGMYHGLNENITSDHYDEQPRSSDIPMLIAITSMSCMLVYSAYLDSPVTNNLRSLLLIVVVLGIIHIVPIERFITNYIQVRITLVAIAVFSMSIYGGIQSEIDHLTSNEYQSPYTFVFTKSPFKVDDEIRFIASTSTHYFIFIPKNKSSYIVKKSHVSLISTKQE